MFGIPSSVPLPLPVLPPFVQQPMIGIPSSVPLPLPVLPLLARVLQCACSTRAQLPRKHLSAQLSRPLAGAALRNCSLEPPLDIAF
jgi:hypothetical protein